jgi:acyl carrier protein
MIPPVGGEPYRSAPRHATVEAYPIRPRQPSSYPARAARNARTRLTPDAKESHEMATTATPQSIEETIIESLVTFGADAGAVNRDATLEEIDIDSLDLVELTQVVEETYGIDLEGSDFKSIKTVGDVVDLVVAKVG